MEWHSFNSGDDRNIRDFLSRWEWKNLSLSQNYRRIRRESLGSMGEREFTVAWVDPKTRSKPGGLLYGGKGMILPLLAEGLPAAEAFKSPLSLPLESPRIVMGEVTAVKCLETQIDRPLGKTINYDLMARIGEPLGEFHLPPDIEIRRGKPSDCQALFPLQRAYVIEEVLIGDSRFNPRLCLQRLELALRGGMILIACHGGVPVAKAETNARGYTFSQVGGVYTKPSYRSRGIARHLMDGLARREWKGKRGLVLFVKKSNIPAQRLYIGRGFHRVGNFRISYYGR